MAKLKKVSKDIKKQLEELASSLPEIKVATPIYVSGAEIKRNDNFKDVRTPDIESHKTYKYIPKGNSTEVFNHKRRIFKIFAEYGMNGVNEYVNQVLQKVGKKDEPVNQ